MELTRDQADAVAAIRTWISQASAQTFTLAGLAGTGKTTVISFLLKNGFKATVLTPTGKAASVLKAKGVAATTIHQAIYMLVDQEEDGQPIFEMKAGARTDFTHGVVIVDEASMVTGEVHKDLLSLRMPVLFVGDHGQLEPVGDDARVMEMPDFTLQTIHRQALQSHILRFAHAVRENGLPSPDWQPYLRKDEVRMVGRDALCPALYSEHQAVIVGHNAHRVKINREMREFYRRNPDYPEPGDRVICLQNDWKRGIANGEVFTVIDVEPPLTRVAGITVPMTVEGDDGRPLKVHPLLGQFNADKRMRLDPGLMRESHLFDYAYAITCHKSQGSEWERVLVIDDHHPSRQSMWNPVRWRYTASTRARISMTYSVTFPAHGMPIPSWVCQEPVAH